MPGFGLKAVKPLGGTIRNKEYPISASDTTKIYMGDLVKWDGTNGVVTQAGVSDADLVGVFVGCRYKNAQGEPKWSKYWTGEANATEIYALVVTDPSIWFEIKLDQLGTAVGLANVGENMDTIGTGGSTLTGRSARYGDSSTSATTQALQLRLEGFVQVPQTLGSVGTEVRALVSINEHWRYAPKQGV